jgi:hypothetical protein
MEKRSDSVEGRWGGTCCSKIAKAPRSVWWICYLEGGFLCSDWGHLILFWILINHTAPVGTSEFWFTASSKHTVTWNYGWFLVFSSLCLYPPFLSDSGNLTPFVKRWVLRAVFLPQSLYSLPNPTWTFSPVTFSSASLPAIFLRPWFTFFCVV